ncbi:carboxypeptidase-like regulatory domain-containing protein [Pedobacter frigidisoli]|uniref:Carboxypeptidase-like regulatory domain-containing protein n=1 Tax=Pedobacter frigidisoli TaxID=2530455 RepID=A0A4R0NYK7_9SPHI|nr:carboxypeptidase-like regulatory domain-containing protein [Pedobacter frigidisoli]TCD07148.1 carboxypeptidase-like regulatory domain-containing protein [Pedobacter frigidisoli]
MKFILFLLSLICCIAFSYAQQSFILSGTIKDKRNQPLPGTGVYVSDYKIATSTDDQGNYILKLKPGNYNILVQLIGFKALNKNVIISDKNINLDFTLEENTTQLSEVTIKPDPNRLSYLNTFKTYFIGLTENAQKCKILNSDVLRFDYDREKSLLTVQTEEFLIIENKALGYKIKYLVKEFQYDYRAGIVYYEGYPTYEDLPGTENQKKKWSEKRQEAFNGSSQQFFNALFNGTSQKDGFIINKLIRNQAEEDLADSIAESQVGGLTSPRLLLPGSISFGTEKKPLIPNTITKIKSNHAVAVLNRAEIFPDTLVHRYNDDIKKIDFTNVLYVIYIKEKESALYKNRINMSVSRTPELANFQISLINLKVPPAYFYKNGGVYNPRSMLFEGYWAWEKIADSVPMDYIPTAAP